MNDSGLLVIALFLIAFTIVMVAPVVEYVIKDSNNNVVDSGSFKVIIPGAQSIMKFDNIKGDDLKVDVKIISGITKEYYLCEGEIIPTTLPEIKKTCSYMGKETN